MLEKTLARKCKQTGKKMSAASIFRKVNIWQQKHTNREITQPINETNQNSACQHK